MSTGSSDSAGGAPSGLDPDGASATSDRFSDADEEFAFRDSRGADSDADFDNEDSAAEDFDADEFAAEDFAKNRKGGSLDEDDDFGFSGGRSSVDDDLNDNNDDSSNEDFADFPRNKGIDEDSQFDGNVSDSGRSSRSGYGHGSEISVTQNASATSRTPNEMWAVSSRVLLQGAAYDRDFLEVDLCDKDMASAFAVQDFRGAQRLWKNLFGMMGHSEAPLRKAALLKIGQLFRIYPLWDLLEARVARKFVTDLLDMIVGDEVEDNRLVATQLLGTTLSGHGEMSSSSGHEQFRRASNFHRLDGSSRSEAQAQRERIRMFVLHFIADAFNCCGGETGELGRYWCFRESNRPVQRVIAVLGSCLGGVIQFEQPETRLWSRSGILFVAYELLASRVRLSPLVVANFLTMLETESRILLSQHVEDDQDGLDEFEDELDEFEQEAFHSDAKDMDLGLLRFCALFVPLMQDMLQDYRDRLVEKAALAFLGTWASVYSRMDELEVRYRAAELRLECVTGFPALLGAQNAPFTGFKKIEDAAKGELDQIRVEVRRRVEGVRVILQRPGTVAQLLAHGSEAHSAVRTASNSLNGARSMRKFIADGDNTLERITGIDGIAVVAYGSAQATVRVALRIPELPEVPENCTTVPPMLFRPGKEHVPMCTPAMVQDIPELQEFVELGFSPYPPPQQGVLELPKAHGAERSRFQILSNKNTSLQVKGIADIENDANLEVNPADPRDPSEVSAHSFGYLSVTTVPAGFLPVVFKNGSNNAKLLSDQPVRFADGWEPPMTPYVDADVNQPIWENGDIASHASSTLSTSFRRQDNSMSDAASAFDPHEYTTASVPIVSAYHPFPKKSLENHVVSQIGSRFLEGGEIEIWITETVNDPIRRFLGQITRVTTADSLTPAQSASVDLRFNNDEDDENEGHDNDDMYWMEDDQVEIRFRTSAGTVFVAMVTVLEVMEDEQSLEMWGSDKDETSANMARSNPIPAGLCSNGKVIFAPPCNLPPEPDQYMQGSGSPLYGAALPLRKRAVACSREGKFAYQINGDVSKLERPLVYSNYGRPFYRTEGGLLPLPTGYTSTGVPFYSAVSIVLHPLFQGYARRRAMVRKALRSTRRHLGKGTSNLIAKLQVATAFMRGRAASGAGFFGGGTQISKRSLSQVDDLESLPSGAIASDDSSSRIGGPVSLSRTSIDASEEEEEDDDDIGFSDGFGFAESEATSSLKSGSTMSLMASLYAGGDDEVKTSKPVQLLFEHAVIEFTHSMSEEQRNITVQTKVAPQHELNVFVMLDPAEVFEVEPAVLRFSPKVTSVTIKIIFRPNKHPERSAPIRGEVRIQDFAGQVLGTAELKGFRGPVVKVSNVQRRPLWLLPGQNSMFVAAVSNLCGEKLDLNFKVVPIADGLQDDTFEDDAALLFAVDTQSLSIFKYQEAFVPIHFAPGDMPGKHEACLCVTTNTAEEHMLPISAFCGLPIVARGLNPREKLLFDADPTDQSRNVQPTLEKKRKSTLRAMRLKSQPTISHLAEGAEILQGRINPVAAKGGGLLESDVAASNSITTGGSMKKNWSQVRKIVSKMSGISGFQVRRRYPYDNPLERPKEQTPFLENLARSAMNKSIAGKSVQDANPDLATDVPASTEGLTWLREDQESCLQIDFGLVDPFQVLKRKFILENISTENVLVGINLKGCGWIKIPNLIGIPGRDQVVVDLQLTGPGDWTGAFDRTIEVTAAILKCPLRIRVIGFVGRALEFPVAPRTYFGTLLPSDEPVTLRIPLVNHSPYDIDFVLLPLGDRFAASVGSTLLDSDTIPGLGYAWIEIQFQPGKCRGIYRAILGLRITRPVSVTYAAAGPCGLIELVGIVTAPSLQGVPAGFDLNRIASIESWVGETRPNSFVGPAGSTLEFCKQLGSISQHTAELCKRCDAEFTSEEMDACQAVEQLAWSVVGENTYQTPDQPLILHYDRSTPEVVLETSIYSDEDTPKSLIVSRGISATAIEASSRIIVNRNSPCVAPCEFGFLAIKNYTQESGSIASHLSSILIQRGGPLSLHLLPRSGKTAELNFGSCLAGTCTRRWAALRNWSIHPVNFTVALPSDLQDRCGYSPFQLLPESSAGILQPFEAVFVPVVYKPESQENLKEALIVTTSLCPDNSNAEEKASYTSHINLVANAYIEAIHGLPEADDLFDFGAIPQGGSTVRTWRLVNRGTTSQELSFTVASPFNVSPRQVVMKPNGEADVVITFFASSGGSYLQELTCMLNGKPSVFLLRGICGEMNLLSSVSHSGGLVQFGPRKYGTISSSFVTVTNTGNLPLCLSRIKYTGLRNLAWQLRRTRITFIGVLPSFTETTNVMPITERPYTWIVLKQRLGHAVRKTRAKQLQSRITGSASIQKIKVPAMSRALRSRASFKAHGSVAFQKRRETSFRMEKPSYGRNSKFFQSVKLKQGSRQDMLQLDNSSSQLNRSMQQYLEQNSGSRPHLFTNSMHQHSNSSSLILSQSSCLLHPEQANLLMSANADAELERFLQREGGLMPRLLIPEAPLDRYQNAELPELPPLKSGDSFILRVSFIADVCIPVSVPIAMDFLPWQVPDMRTDVELGDAEILSVESSSFNMRLEGTAVRRLVFRPQQLSFKPTAAQEHFPPDVHNEGTMMYISATNESLQPQSFHCARCNNLSFEIPDSALVVEPGCTVTIPVRFRPIHANTEYHAQLALEDVFGRRNVSLSGVGAAARVEAKSDAVRFSAIKFGVESSAKLVLSNSGSLKATLEVLCESPYFSSSQEIFVLGASGGTEAIFINCCVPVEDEHLFEDLTTLDSNLKIRWQLVPDGHWSIINVPIVADIGRVILEADALQQDMGLVTLHCPSTAKFILRNVGTAFGEWTVLMDRLVIPSYLKVDFSATDGQIEPGEEVEIAIQIISRHCDLLDLVIPIKTDSGQLELRLCGQVVAPQVHVPENRDIDFGVILVGAHAQKVFKIQNTGRTEVDVRSTLYLHDQTIKGARKSVANKVLSMWNTGKDDSAQEGKTRGLTVARSALRQRVSELKHSGPTPGPIEATVDPDQDDRARVSCFSIGPVHAKLSPGESVTLVIETAASEDLPGVDKEATVFLGNWTIRVDQIPDQEWGGSLRSKIGKLDARINIPSLLQSSALTSDDVLMSYFGICMVHHEFIRKGACEFVNHGTIDVEFLIQPEDNKVAGEKGNFSIYPLSGHLAPAERISVDVAFLAKTEGFHQVISDVRFRPVGNALKTGQVRQQLAFAATSGLPRLICTEGELNFGRCQIDGHPEAKTLILQSIGNCPVSWSARIIEGGDFFTVDVANGTIPAQDDHAMNVKFAPKRSNLAADEDLLDCRGILLIEWAGQTPYEVILMGEGARGRLTWSLADVDDEELLAIEDESKEQESQTPVEVGGKDLVQGDKGISFGTRPNRIGSVGTWRHVCMQNEGKLSLECRIECNLPRNIFSICFSEEEKKQRDMEIQIERRFDAAELDRTLTGEALEMGRLMAKKAFHNKNGDRTAAPQGATSSPAGGENGSNQLASVPLRKIRLEPGETTTIFIGFYPSSEEKYRGSLEFLVLGTSDQKLLIPVSGAGGEFCMEVIKPLEQNNIGVGFVTLDSLSIQNSGLLGSWVELTVEPAETQEQMTFIVEESTMGKGQIIQKQSGRAVYELEALHEKERINDNHRALFRLGSHTQVTVSVGYWAKAVGKLNGTILLRPCHPDLQEVVDLNFSPNKYSSTNRRGVKGLDNMGGLDALAGPFGKTIPISADAINNRLRLSKKSNFAMGRLPFRQKCTDTRSLLNGTDMEIKFVCRLSKADDAWKVSPSNGKIEPGGSVDLQVSFTAVDEDTENWHDVEIEVFNETTGVCDIHLRGYGSVGSPELSTNLDGQSIIDFGQCQLSSSISIPIIFRNRGTGMLHVKPRIEYESTEDYEQVLFLGWQRPNSTHRNRAIPAKLDLAVGQTPEFLDYAQSIGELSHPGDGVGEGIEQPVYYGFGVLAAGAELCMMLSFCPRFRGNLQAKLIIDTNIERGRGGGAREVMICADAQSFDLQMDRLQNCIDFGRWNFGEVQTTQLILQRRGSQDVPLKLLFGDASWDPRWKPPFGAGGILAGEGGLLPNDVLPTVHELGHLELSRSVLLATENEDSVVEVRLGIPDSWLDAKKIPAKQHVHRFRALMNAQSQSAVPCSFKVYLLRPGNLPPFPIELKYVLTVPRVIVELSDPLPTDAEKGVVRIRDLSAGGDGQDSSSFLNEEETARVGAVLSFGSILTKQAVSKSFVLSTDSTMYIPFKAQIIVHKHPNSTENYNAYFSLSRKEGVLVLGEPIAVKLRCNFPISFDSLHNPVKIVISFLHGALPEMILPVHVKTMDHIFKAESLGPIRFTDPVFVGQSQERILSLENITEEVVEARVTFPDAAFYSPTANPIKLGPHKVVDYPVVFRPREDALYETTVEIQVDDLIFSVSVTGQGSQASIKLKPSQCLDFGFVGAMLNKADTLTVRNTSMLPMFFELERTGGSWFSVKPNRLMVKARSSQSVQVVFMPVQEKSYEGAIIIHAFDKEPGVLSTDGKHLDISHDAELPTKSVPAARLLKETVRVLGIGGRVSLDFPRVLNFGRVSTHIRQAAYLHVKNSGDVELNVRLVARDAEEIGTVNFAPSEVSLLPAQSVDINVLLTLRVEAQQSFWIDLSPVSNANDGTLTSPYSWAVKVAAFGDKINLSEELQRILREERLPKLEFRSDDVEDLHLHKVIAPIVRLPKMSIKHLVSHIEPSLEYATGHLENILARPAPLVTETPPSGLRPKWHHNRTPLRLDRSSDHNTSNSLSTTYTFSNSHWKTLFSNSVSDEEPFASAEPLKSPASPIPPFINRSEENKASNRQSPSKPRHPARR